MLATGTRTIVALLLAWGSGLPGLVGAEPLVEIKHFSVCRFYFRQVDANVSKVYVEFTRPERIPSAIRSITVEGPDGFTVTLNQAPFTLLNWNGYNHVPDGSGTSAQGFYVGFSQQPMADGVYTLTVVDTAGNVLRRSRTFHDDSGAFIANVDAIDVSQFVPVDGARRVSRTPVISWDIAEGAGLYYVLRIWRNGDLVLLDNVFENGTGLDKDSFAVPSGVLDRGAHYNWAVEVCDSDVFEDIDHCGLLPMLDFRTAR